MKKEAAHTAQTVRLSARSARKASCAHRVPYGTKRNGSRRVPGHCSAGLPQAGRGRDGKSTKPRRRRPHRASRRLGASLTSRSDRSGPPAPALHPARKVQIQPKAEARWFSGNQSRITRCDVGKAPLRPGRTEIGSETSTARLLIATGITRSPARTPARYRAEKAKRSRSRP